MNDLPKQSTIVEDEDVELEVLTHGQLTQDEISDVAHALQDALREFQAVMFGKDISILMNALPILLAHVLVELPPEEREPHRCIALNIFEENLRRVLANEKDKLS